MVRITPEGVEVVVGRPSPYSTGGQSTSDTTIDTVDFEPEIGEIIEPATQVSLTEGSDAAQYIALSIDDARAGNFIDSNRIYYQYWDDLVFVYEGDGVYSIYHRGDDTSNPNNILGRTNEDGFNVLTGRQGTPPPGASTGQEDAAYGGINTGQTVQPMSTTQQFYAATQRIINESKGRGSYTTDFMGNEALVEPLDDEGKVQISYVENGRRIVYVLDQETGQITDRYFEDLESGHVVSSSVETKPTSEAHDEHVDEIAAEREDYTTDHTPETGLDEAHDEHVAEITAEREAYTTAHTPETGLDEAHDDTTSSSSGPERMTGIEDAEYGYYPESASGQQVAAGPSLTPEDTQTGTLRDTLYSASDIEYSRQTQQPPIGTITSTGVGSHTPEATIAPNPEAAFQEEFQTSILPRIENDELQFGGINVFRPSTAEIEFNGYPAELSSDMGNYVVTYTDNQGTEISQVFSGEDGTYIRTIKN